MELRECILNAPERLEYTTALKALEPILYNLPEKVVVIDGRPGVGKTTLGRFLAWRFNVSLIETDLFLDKSQGHYSYREEDLKAVITSRKISERPVIVEGVVALRVLDDINIQPDFHIHVTCEDATASLTQDYEAYVKKYTPKKNADISLDLPTLPRA